MFFLLFFFLFGQDGSTAVMLAAEEDHQDIVKMLIEAEVELETKERVCYQQDVVDDVNVNDE